VGSYECSEDYGVDGGDPDKGRLVEVDFHGAGAAKELVRGKCSCQFGISFGVGICRHMLAVSLSQQAQCMRVENFFVSKWRHHSDASLANLRVLLSTKAPWPANQQDAGDWQSARTPNPASAATSVPIASDGRSRRALSTPLSHRLLELAGVSDEHSNLIHKGLTNLLHDAERLCTGDGQTCPAGAQRTRPGIASTKRDQAHTPSSHACASTEPDVDPSYAPILDSLSGPMRLEVMSVLHNDYQIAPPRPFDPHQDEVFGYFGKQCELMVGRYILYKWSLDKMVGGAKTEWHVGKVIKALDTMDGEERLPGNLGTHAKNFSVQYGATEVQSQALLACNCLNWHPQTSPGVARWFLLEEKPLHNTPQGGIKPPAYTRQTGRPGKATRKAPPAGPTSTQSAKAKDSHKKKKRKVHG